MRRGTFLLFLCLTYVVSGAQGLELKLPLKPDSVRFAVIGDSGTGGQPQYETAAEMAAAHRRFPFDS